MIGTPGDEGGAPLAIQVRRAAVHNLRKVDVDVPLRRMVAIAGVASTADEWWRRVPRARSRETPTASPDGTSPTT